MPFLLVGAAGFEPTTPCSQSRCSTGLSHAPTNRRRWTGYRSAEIRISWNVDPGPGEKVSDFAKPVNEIWAEKRSLSPLRSQMRRISLAPPEAGNLLHEEQSTASLGDPEQRLQAAARGIVSRGRYHQNRRHRIGAKQIAIFCVAVGRRPLDRRTPRRHLLRRRRETAIGSAHPTSPPIASPSGDGHWIGAPHVVTYCFAVGRRLLPDAGCEIGL